jgi:UDP-N-acetylmuramoylalanine--D-glutamate ligase
MDRAKAYFKGKKVTIMGLGLLGKGLGDALFIARCGAEVTITDFKTKDQLAASVAQLKKFKNVQFVLGEHRMQDFENADIVLKAQGVTLDSPYIAHARKNNVPVRMDDELFVSLAPKNVHIVGVTGTRGKTTTATLIYHILKKAGKRVHLAGNIRGVATLALLPKIKSGDYVVLELSSWQLQGFGDAKISPHVSVFTNFMPDHMNYYNNSLKDYFSDKALIFKNQKAEDTLVIGESLVKKIPASHKGKTLIALSSDIPKAWKLQIAGEHNKENIALAVSAARALKIPFTKIRAGVESFKAVEGRLQYVRSIGGVQIYNDNNSTTPEATLAALKAFPQGKVVLIMGGADKNLNMNPLMKFAEKHTKAIVFLSGTGTDKLGATSVPTLSSAVDAGMGMAEKGDVLLFSPAFASFGMFSNEYDRNDQFLALVKKIK